MQQQINFLDTYCGKTSQEPTPQTEAMTSTQSSRRFVPSVTKEYQFLDLRMGFGNLLGAYWETATVLPGGRSTRNTGESPSAAVESSLSDVLEMNAPEKYCLSPKACNGILRRAEKRGKTLPDMLKQALMEVVSQDGCPSLQADDDEDDTEDCEEYEDE